MYDQEMLNRVAYGNMEASITPIPEEDKELLIKALNEMEDFINDPEDEYACCNIGNDRIAVKGNSYSEELYEKDVVKLGYSKFSIHTIAN